MATLEPLQAHWRGKGQPRGFDGNVQTIAAAAHARGVVLTRRDVVAGSVEAAVLCRVLRAAHERTRGDATRHAHVEAMAAAIAHKLGAKGPVVVSQTAWNLIQGYAVSTPRRGEHHVAPDR